MKTKENCENFDDGVTQVAKEFKAKLNLSETIARYPKWGYPEEDVKEKIQNTQRRFKEEFILDYAYDTEDIRKRIDKIFLEEFGDKLVEEKK